MKYTCEGLGQSKYRLLSRTTKVKTKHNVFWALHIVESVDNFGVSFTILLGKENYGQASIKCLDLACDVELAPLKICKDLTSKLEVKYFFPT